MRSAGHLEAVFEKAFPGMTVVRRGEGILHVTVPPVDVVSILSRASVEQRLRVLQLISAVDRIEEGRMQLTWILEDPTDSFVFIVSSRYPRAECTVPTVSGMWPAAEAFERELHEMYGIDFPGSPRQGEDFLLEGWKGVPPMLRDFDTLDYSMRTFGERWPREHVDPRRYIGEKVGEWDTPLGSGEEGE